MTCPDRIPGNPLFMGLASLPLIREGYGLAVVKVPVNECKDRACRCCARKGLYAGGYLVDSHEIALYVS